MQRFGRILKLQPGAEKSYDSMHADVWPEVLSAIRQAGIRNYSIYRYHQWLFSYYELPDGVSTEEVDRVFEESETCRQWEEQMQKLQAPLPESDSEGWWVGLPEIFHCEGTTT